MNANRKYTVSIAIVFIWIGFVGAISFMEAWLKFQAPGITVPLGLGIGKLVFGALNTMEWSFTLVILIDLFRKKPNPSLKSQLPFFIAIVIVALQSIWLLPALDQRAELLIAGEDPEESILHFFYVGFEMLKLACLFIYGIKLLKTLKKA